MKKASIVATLVCLLFVTACGKKNGDAYPAIKETPLVIVAHDAKGNLKDFRVIKDVSAIHSVTVTPAAGGQEIYVTVLGSKRQPSFQTDTCMGTKDAADFKGTVNVVIENGLVMSATGDIPMTPSPLNTAALDKISANLATGQLLAKENSLISVGE